VTLDIGITYNLEVTWQEGDYDPNEVGVYVIKGDLTLVKGIKNPDGLQAEFEIAVKAGSVTTDAQEYTAGGTIAITVELFYEEQQDGEYKYPAQIFIGPRYYSKLLTFTNGVAVAGVTAEKAGDDQQVKVRVELEEDEWVEMTATETVKIQPGEADKLGVTGDADGAWLEAQDEYGNRVYTYEGGKTIEVTYKPKGIGALAAGYKIAPDRQVAVKFSEGRARVLYGEFEFAPDLEAGKTYEFTFTVVEDELTGTTDYTYKSQE